MAGTENEGKSEATVLVEMLLDEMKRMLESAKEAFGVPFGAQEVTRATWRKWFTEQATPEQRAEQIAQRGAVAVAQDLGLFDAMGGNGASGG